MRTRMAALMAAVPLLLGTAAVTAATGASAMVSPVTASSPCGTLTTAPTYTHVIWIWMENHSYNTIIGSPQAPYINGLASACGLATNYHNISHPSLPNYIAATSGLGLKDIKKFATDCSPSRHCSTPAPSMFGQGETWKGVRGVDAVELRPGRLRRVRGAPQPAAVLHDA
jgi:phosphatidylinositol-3-phosphatase